MGAHLFFPFTILIATEMKLIVDVFQVLLYLLLLEYECLNIMEKLILQRVKHVRTHVAYCKWMLRRNIGKKGPIKVIKLGPQGLRMGDVKG